MRSMLWLYFGTDGRLTRGQWWAGGLLLAAIGLVLVGIELTVLGVTTSDLAAGLDPKQAGTALARSIRRDLDVIGACDSALLFVPWVCLSVKRRHDRGQSGADYLALAVLGLVLSVARAAPHIPGIGLPASFAAGLVPASVVGALFGVYLLVVLGFRGTVRGANFYGPDPFAPAAADLPYAGRQIGPGAAYPVPFRPADGPPPRNPIVRYWRGAYPLGWSFWLVNVPLGILLEAGLIGFLRLFDPDGTIDPLPGFFAIAAAGLVLAVGTVWLRVGAFRAAQRRATERHLAGRRAFLPRLAQVLVMAPLLLDAGIVYFVAVLLLVFFPMAFANDPAIPDYAVRVLPGGTAIEIEGGIKYGLAAAVKAALAEHPRARTLVLESPGGRLGASEQVAALVSAQGLDTRVSTHCESACTRIFVAGRERVLRQGGKLGFHSGRTDLQLPAAVTAAMNRTFADRYIAAGVDASFMARAEAVAASDIWYPSDAELVAAHVVTRIEGGPAVTAAPSAPGQSAGHANTQGEAGRKNRRAP